MHCALAGIPGAVVYKANPLTYQLARWLVRVPHLGIANLLLDEPMYPEFIQGAATAAALAAELHSCLHDGTRRARAPRRPRNCARGWPSRPAAPRSSGCNASWGP